MSLLRFPAATPAPDFHRPARPGPTPAAGTILVVAAADQTTLPNLALAGLRATFADAAAIWTGASDADVLLICAGEGGAGDLKEILRDARVRGIPVIVWGEIEPDRRIALLEAGVQDVVSTACDPREFRARLQVQLRRRDADAQPAAWRLVIPSRALVAPDGSVVHLSSSLTDILRMLIEADGGVVGREHLAAAFYDRLTSRALDAQISRLRRRLRTHGCRILLHSVKGLGYSLRFLDGPVLIDRARS